MANVIAVQDRFRRSGLGPVPPGSFAGGGLPTSEIGHRTTPESRIRATTLRFWVDPNLRASILDIRRMDHADGRVKRIHKRLARDTIRGGLHLCTTEKSPRIQKLWEAFERRLQLDNASKLLSDARGLVMEGNLPMQWVVADGHVVTCARMPAETIKPTVDENGRFTDPSNAYEQLDVVTMKSIAKFPLWQLAMGRLDPDNWDDFTNAGRPYLDASREIWLKLGMTEEDLVIRRRERAPLRTAHVLEGASPDELLEYKARVEDEQKDITTNYYLNKKGAVTAVQGDANLGEIADVVHLLDTFFSGAPMPKALLGYTEGLARDVLQDLKADYFDEVDLTQEELEFVYQTGFNLELLLQGIDPAAHDAHVEFAERRTETANQAADRALKYQALGASKATQLETAGLNPIAEKERLTQESKEMDPYPQPEGIGGTPGAPAPRVAITPGNAPKGESATTISTRNSAP